MSLIINKKRLCVTFLSSIVIAVTLMVNSSTLIQVFSQETPTLLTSEPTTTMPQPNLHLVTANNTEGTSGWPGPDRP